MFFNILYSFFPLCHDLQKCKTSVIFVQENKLTYQNNDETLTQKNGDFSCLGLEDLREIKPWMTGFVLISGGSSLGCAVPIWFLLLMLKVFILYEGIILQCKQTLKPFNTPRSKTFAVLLKQIFIQRTYLVSNLYWPKLTLFAHLFVKIEFGSQSIRV